MNEQQAISKMIAPGTKRPGKYLQGVIQVWVTRSCDKTCFGCTQGSNLRGHSGFISLEHFEQACLSLKDYFGVVGVFGGNPCIHPQFEELCKILRDIIPYSRRGLWSNKLFGHGKVCRETFCPSICNINVHCDEEAAREVSEDWPNVRIVGRAQDSRHSPPYVAMKDVIPDEEARWNLISDCDINKHWSAMIAPFRGELRAYFCEIAGAMAVLHQDDKDYPDLGMQVTNDWWRKPLQDFAPQVRHFCHDCGIPLRIKGELSQEAQGIEFVSETHLKVYNPKKTNHRVKVVRSLEDLPMQKVPRIIDYLKNAKK